MNEPGTVSRRMLLGRAALTIALAGSGGFARQAAAQEKVSKADAKYQDQPKGEQRCAICLQFQPPNSCKIVEGQISPKGWCQFFAGRENAK